MIKGEYEYLNDLAKNNLCADHLSELLVATHPTESCYVLRCGHDHYPDNIIPWLSLTEEFKQGFKLPEPIKSNVEKGIDKRGTRPSKQSTAVTFRGIPAADLGSGQLIPRETLEALVKYAEDYGLDPRRSHVVLYFGKPYIGLDGYLFHANRSKRPYSLRSRPMTTEEAKTFKIGETDHGWIAELEILDTKGCFIGVGIVTYEEMTAKSERDPTQFRAPVVAKHPWQLAQKRAEWQVLRRGFPIGEERIKSDETRD